MKHKGPKVKTTSRGVQDGVDSCLRLALGLWLVGSDGGLCRQERDCQPAANPTAANPRSLRKRHHVYFLKAYTWSNTSHPELVHIHQGYGRRT
jgi:hypothetical protein